MVDAHGHFLAVVAKETDLRNMLDYACCWCGLLQAKHPLLVQMGVLCDVNIYLSSPDCQCWQGAWLASCFCSPLFLFMCPFKNSDRRMGAPGGWVPQEDDSFGVGLVGPLRLNLQTNLSLVCTFRNTMAVPTVC